MEQKFSDFKESDKSPKHKFKVNKVNLNTISVTCAFPALWQHTYFLIQEITSSNTPVFF